MDDPLMKKRLEDASKRLHNSLQQLLKLQNQKYKDQIENMFSSIEFQKIIQQVKNESASLINVNSMENSIDNLKSLLEDLEFCVLKKQNLPQCINDIKKIAEEIEIQKLIGESILMHEDELHKNDDPNSVDFVLHSLRKLNLIDTITELHSMPQKLANISKDILINNNNNDNNDKSILLKNAIKETLNNSNKLLNISKFTEYGQVVDKASILYSKLNNIKNQFKNNLLSGEELTKELKDIAKLTIDQVKFVELIASQFNIIDPISKNNIKLSAEELKESAVNLLSSAKLTILNPNDKLPLLNSMQKSSNANINLVKHFNNLSNNSLENELDNFKSNLLNEMNNLKRNIKEGTDDEVNNSSQKFQRELDRIIVLFKSIAFNQTDQNQKEKILKSVDFIENALIDSKGQKILNPLIDSVRSFPTDKIKKQNLDNLFNKIEDFVEITHFDCKNYVNQQNELLRQQQNPIEPQQLPPPPPPPIEELQEEESEKDELVFEAAQTVKERLDKLSSSILSSTTSGNQSYYIIISNNNTL
jgi:hypothetical protein